MNERQQQDPKPTPGAMRAADRICNLQGWHDFDKSNNPSLRKDLSLIDDLARIIDEENQSLLADRDRLLKACKNTVEELDDLWSDYQNGRDIDVSHLVASMLQPLRTAIAKAQEIKD